MLGDLGKFRQVGPDVGGDDHERATEALDLHSQQVGLAGAALAEYNRDARLLDEGSNPATRAPVCPPPASRGARPRGTGST
eukprot:15260071-Alexandrium_andersonii.AAC.1